jgi:hypothetical protein
LPGPAVLLLVVLAAQLSEPPPSAIVAGRVVDAASGRPIAGAIVIPAGSAVITSPGASGPGTALTNAEGHFVLRGLAKGSLVLTATKGGYVNATYGQRRPGGTAQPLPVETDQRIAGIEVRMWKYGAITGTIVDEAGDPVVSTRVSVLQKTFVASRKRFKPGPAATTDDRGMYRIAGLTPGEYVVVVPSTQTSVPTDVMESFFTGTPVSETKRMELSRELGSIGSAIAPAGSQFAMRASGQTFSLPNGTMTQMAGANGIMVYPTAYYPDAPAPGQALPITVRSGEERSGVDLQVRPVRGVRVAGTLMGPDGPVATTAVRLMPAASDDALDPLSAASTITDGSGAFVFPAVPAGSYVLRVLRIPRDPINLDDVTHVRVVPDGSMTISSTPARPAGPPPVPRDATLVAQMPLEVGNRDVNDLVVSLAAGPRVSGRVEFEGTIARPPVPSITGMRITLDPADGSTLPDATLALQTGRPEENGEFRTYGVPPGRYVVRVSPLPAGWFLKSALYQNRDIADTPLELAARDVSGVVITFTDRPSGISGTVRGAEGPDPAAIVLLYPVDSAAWSSSGALSRRLRTARATADGSYSLQALPAGEYYLVAVREDQVGEWQDPALLRALSSHAITIRLVDGDRKTQDLRSAEIR